MDKKRRYGAAENIQAEVAAETGGNREVTVFGESLKGRSSGSIWSRYRLTQGKTLAQKIEGVPNMDAHDGNAPTPVLN